MTRKDFELIAKALYGELPGGESSHRQPFENVCGAVADALATTNPRFDRARFLAACGVS